MKGVRKPAWLKVKAGGGSGYAKVRDVLASCSTHTVCEEARCPNRGECWSSGTATFMILGDTCTRGCRFCAVKTSDEGCQVDPEEPGKIAEAAGMLSLRYVVVTSVDRDDLPDNGSGHFRECIRRLKGGGLAVEALIPDYLGLDLARVLDAKPDVLAHNIEVVERLQPVRDARASYMRSLRTLREAKQISPGLRTKSSIMVGLGETEEEVLSAMDGLRAAGCDMLVIGQYLQPTVRQVPVSEYVTPAAFKRYADEARRRGFTSVVSSPLARTSYRAAEAA